MESLIKQTRSRFGGSKEDRSSSSTTDRRIPPEKTQSFREKKRSQGYSKKQLSRQMSWEHDFNSSDYPTAVAAAAYAIQSLEESNYWDKNERNYRKTKIRSEEREENPEPLKSALKSLDGTPKTSFSDEGSAGKRLPSDKKPTRKISFADLDEVISHNNGVKLPDKKARERAPSMNRPSTSADKQLSMADSRKSPEAALPKPARLPLKSPPPPPPPFPLQTKRSFARKPGPEDSAAAAWEKEKMASINERYERLRATIDGWETKKKKKAKRKIESIEFQAELDNRKAKAIEKYNREIARIAQIAGGARVQADENRRKEEIKVKEKANKIRATGKIPSTCLCF